jgi:hypothetical protein
VGDVVINKYRVGAIVKDLFDTIYIVVGRRKGGKATEV